MTAWSGAPIRRGLLIMGWVLAIALAVGLRLWFWSYQAGSGAVQPGDPEEYYRAALYLLQGSYHDTGKWLRPPIYPLFLAGCFALFGVNPDRALLVQAILSGISMPAFGWLAYRLFGRGTTALLAGLIAAVFVPLAHYGSVLFAEGLFVILAVLGLAALDRAAERGTVWAALLAGLFFGLAALTRAVAVSFLPIAALLLLLRPGEAVQQFPRRWLPGLLTRARLWPPAALLLGAALVISPWAFRNALVHQRLILSDTNGGISMWYGTIRSDAEQRAGEEQLWAVPNPADRQALALRWTIEAITSDPLWFLGRMRYKVASLYLLQLRSYAAGDIITISPRDEQVALGAGENPLVVSVVADAQYIGVMLLAIAGAAFAPNRRRLMPVLFWVAFITFMSAMTIGHPRLRVPILAALIPVAAYGLVIAWEAIRRRRASERMARGWLAAMLAGWLVFAALIVSTRYITWARTWPDLGRARTALTSGDPVSAQGFLEHARAIDPGNALRVIDLADLAFRTGDNQRAIDLYGQALTLEDRSLYAHAMRARMARLLGLPGVARAEQAALAGYGRDNNEVARWAWQAWDDPRSDRVVPGDPIALGQYVGFAPATPDLPAGRWTLGDAQIRLSNGCGNLVLRVRGPTGRSVTITLQERALTTMVRLTGVEQEIRLPIVCEDRSGSAPEQANAAHFTLPPATVRIQSETTLLDIERAPWYVGAAVLEARIEREP